MNSKTFYSNGKLLLSGEYVVLDGALALAVPTKLGQSLIVEHINAPKIIWESYDDKKTIWFKDEFLIENFSPTKNPSHDVSKRLTQIFNAIKKLNPNHFKINSGFKISTHLGFPTNWGLGTSSTLINNLAQWANLDAYQLLELTFGGSGYDIACAKTDTPITYQLLNGNPIVNSAEFNPVYKDHLYFVHLNKKQNSRTGIKNYNINKNDINSVISDISEITKKLISCNNLSDFETLITQHESIIAQVTKQEPVKQLLFTDFKGSVKSLGAWGGDFVLATSINDPTAYFKDKGFDTVIPYNKMVL